MSQPYYYPVTEPGTDITGLPAWPPSYRSGKLQLPGAEITPGRLAVHGLLLFLTALTTSGIGALLFWDDASAEGVAKAVASGLTFAFTLLMILGAHEMGHYIACRWYGVRATLPYFIPVPLGVGTFGAFIKIKSPIPSRRALFDIGIAGPLAGFVFAIPAALVAHYFAAGASTWAFTDDSLNFQSPLFFVLIERLFHLPPDIEINPVWFATWVGLLMTSLNLLPVGQLDGGHVVYSVFGRRGHRLIARSIYAIVVGLAVYSLWHHGWLGWVVYAVILTLVLRIGHPPVIDEREQLGTARKLVAAIGLIVFLLCFMPAPVTY